MSLKTTFYDNLLQSAVIQGALNSIKITFYLTKKRIKDFNWTTKSRRRPLEGHLQNFSGSDTNKTEAECLSFYYSKLLCCPDAGADGAEPTSGFVIKDYDTSCSMWWPMYRKRSLDVICDLFSEGALTIQ